MTHPPRASGIVPAQLGFLAIYSPGLGTTDETIDDQIVYYGSASTQSSPRRRRQRASTAGDGRPIESVSKEERNERLRQIGLAQGMVEFARSFSGGQPVDAIDTERSRVVLHELEPGWWILASIDLTRLPLPTSKTAAVNPLGPGPSSPPPKETPPSSSQQQQKFEYSSRELKPPLLLLQDLLRAHTLFLLHHGHPSLAALYATGPSSSSSSRSQFTALLARYWDRFLPTWNVLLHGGNPACAVMGGIKIAASGELGIGVGEEERGSGEREVLEGLVGSVEGLVDLVVGRFGWWSPVVKKLAGPGVGHGKVGRRGGKQEERKGEEEEEVSVVERWLGVGEEVGAEDGAVFLGVGALSRRSLRAVTCWMEDIYTWGENAYGVANGAAGSGSRAKRRRAEGKKTMGADQTPPTTDDNAGQTRGKSKSPGPPTLGDAQPGPATPGDATAENGEAGGGMDKMLSYLKLGYGTYWSLGMSGAATNSDTEDGSAKPTDAAEGNNTSRRSAKQDRNTGRFLMGLAEQNHAPEQQDTPSQTNTATQPTVSVELEAGVDQSPQPGSDTPGTAATDAGNRDRKKPNTAELCPVIYIHRPFIYILLFQPTISQPWSELSQSLDVQLSRLHKPLLTSTAYRPEKPIPGGGGGGGGTAQSDEIYDLVFDPHTLAIHSTIPNIPDPADLPLAPPPISRPPPPPPPWTRAEALSTHNQILNMYAGTRRDLSVAERTCKTSRGWWVVWNRSRSGEGPNDGDGDDDRVGDDVLRAAAEPEGTATSTSTSRSGSSGVAGSGSGGDSEKEGGVGAGAKEIFLVRRASDHAGGGGVRGVSTSYIGGSGGGAAAAGGTGGWADGASRLAQGIGVDTRRYIEGLLSLNR
ncbi:uncharacterized protein B0T15DRAFT_132061 [Chaetomium strumarium]|uniref:CCZ1/INTU/HSP4 first Longin domain-containing protein n=1 Tax=Chaetomium strumarium TaxID=1170767 RepID=A0AAJ0M533_9PEZI|nr:hypothetical protein B0T15DRAFT_132061 [Chaetomium strumarium]